MDLLYRIFPFIFYRQHGLLKGLTEVIFNNLFTVSNKTKVKDHTSYKDKEMARF